MALNKSVMMADTGSGNKKKQNPLTDLKQAVSSFGDALKNKLTSLASEAAANYQEPVVEEPKAPTPVNDQTYTQNVTPSVVKQVVTSGYQFTPYSGGYQFSPYQGSGSKFTPYESNLPEFAAYQGKVPNVTPYQGNVPEFTPYQSGFSYDPYESEYDGKYQTRYETDNPYQQTEAPDAFLYDKYQQSEWDRRADALGQQLMASNFENWMNGSTYQDLAKRYAENGQNAMLNTLGEIAGRTGGLASSYASAAASQQYNNYMQQLMDTAYDMYQTERSNLRADSETARQYGDLLYGRWLDEQNRSAANADNEYARWMDEQNLARQDDEMAYERWLNEQNMLRQDDATAYERYLQDQAFRQEADNIAYQRWLNDQNFAREDDATAYKRWLDEQNMARDEEAASYQRWLDEQNLRMSLDDTAYQRYMAEQNIAREDEQNAYQRWLDEQNIRMALDDTAYQRYLYDQSQREKSASTTTTTYTQPSYTPTQNNDAKKAKQDSSGTVASNPIYQVDPNEGITRYNGKDYTDITKLAADVINSGNESDKSYLEQYLNSFPATTQKAIKAQIEKKYPNFFK